MAGGAEVLTHELAKRWAMQGHRVTLFTSSFPGAPTHENVDGFTVIRRGQWWNVQAWALFYYIFFFRRTIDVIIDEVHWFPFFSVLYAPKKTVLLVCEVAHQLFFKLFRFPISILGRFLEKLYIILYRSVPVLAISKSTKEALIVEGIHPERITVIPMGLSLPNRIKRYGKGSRLTLIVAGRLHMLKGTVDAIEAYAHIRKLVPSAKLWIVGSDGGGYQRELVHRANTLGVGEGVTFFGRVTENKKFELLGRAHVLLMPSFYEGWGLVVTEAASQGTPAVGYRTAGVQDVIMQDKTGILVEAGNPEELAAKTLKLWSDKERYRRYQTAGKKRAASMHWDDTARVALTVIEKIHEKK